MLVTLCTPSGRRNYRAFYIFLLATTLYAAFTAILTIGYMAVLTAEYRNIYNYLYPDKSQLEWMLTRTPTLVPTKHKHRTERLPLKSFTHSKHGPSDLLLRNKKNKKGGHRSDTLLFPRVRLQRRTSALPHISSAEKQDHERNREFYE